MRIYFRKNIANSITILNLLLGFISIILIAISFVDLDSQVGLKTVASNTPGSRANVGQNARPATLFLSLGPAPQLVIFQKSNGRTSVLMILLESICPF